MAAITIDGKIGREKKDKSTNWTSSADKKKFQEITKKAGLVIMGRSTFETIGKALPDRKIIVLTSRPLEQTPQKGIEFHNKTPIELKKYLKNQGYSQAILCGGAQTYTDFLQAGLVDTLAMTIEPKMFGTGINLINAQSCELNLELLSYEKIGVNSIFLKYKVKKHT